MSGTSFFESAASNFFEDENEQETQVNEPALYDTRDMVIFAIDCSPKMFIPDSEGYTSFTKSFKCVQSVLLSKVFSNASDLVGVLLYGTEKKENAASFDHVYILQELDLPSPARIKEAENLMNNEKSFEQEYGITTDEFPLGNVFWTCADMFSATTKKKGSKRIFLITNEDNPHGSNGNLRNAALQRAKDLLDMNIRIELFGLDQPDHTFNYKYFYQDVFSHDNNKDAPAWDDEEDVTLYEKGSAKLEELMVKIRRKEVKKRSLFRIPFHIGKELTIGIQGYALLTEQKKGSTKKVLTSGERIQEVQPATAYQCVDSGLFLTDLDVKYCFPFGEERVVFTKDEINELKAFGDPGMTILGFKPQWTLQPHYNFHHSYFIYPNENEYEGSTRTFTALLEALSDQDKIAICSLIQRKNTIPRLVALLPQKEKRDNEGIQLTPPGFHLIYLPYADDLRSLPVESTPQASSEQVGAMKSMINKLLVKGDYDPLMFENPSLQQHYAALQAIALDESLERIPDNTVPKFDTIDKRLGDDILHFKNLLPEFGNMEEPVRIKRERKDIGDSEAASNKRQRSMNVEDAWKDHQLDKLTVPVLKEWLNSKGIAPKGLKANLIDQVNQAMAKKG